MSTNFSPLSRTQSIEQPDYPALESLHRAGDDLPRYQRWVSKLFSDAASRVNAKKILDFGCGTGILSAYYQAATAIQPVGLEIDHRLRACAQARGFEIYGQLAQIKTEFDFIFSSNVLEHIEDDGRALADLREVLKPGGYLALFLPAFPFLWSSMDSRVGHFRRYRANPLCQMLADQGFEIEQCRYYDSMGFFATMAYKLLPSSSGEPSAVALRIFDKFIFPISQITDKFLGSLFGKNVFVLAKKI
ncbi:class I SAM-dependent methyltransferase [Xenophilus arseniciresistens]|uniref:Class I SAM-dependent methyltransferase n=1 Tax=Xenophilus arseniciresistens TaxID=1283306 RepID=A0AAE3NCI5_9BURK|nr:class I SAM-dependent methyltransferase [Xenophilus arseniciresistens]MDA7418898.1 class I SAM-dependent methyltransferase [Xenophilus arseniciresistens]